MPPLIPRPVLPTSGVDLTFATHLAASSRSECQIQNSTRNLYLLVVFRFKHSQKIPAEMGSECLNRTTSDSHENAPAGSASIGSGTAMSPIPLREQALVLMRRTMFFAVWLIVVAGLWTTGSARAVEAIKVPLSTPAIDLTAATEQHTTETGRIQVSTAPESDGTVRRIEVRALEHNNHWTVFALTNNSDEQVDRLIVVPHYRMVGSGLLRPDLGLSRVVAITPSSGDRPIRQESTTADIFRITLDPGTIITFVAELRTGNLPQVYLWEPDAYKDKVNSFTLYYGIVIGIAGLLALFLTILFVVKGSVMFPAAAALSWAVLVYIGIDFGFWGKIFETTAEAERVWRACGEAVLSATLLVFLFAYLNLSRWHVRYAHITAGWLAALAALIAVAVFKPEIAAGIARLSLGGIAVFGLALVIYLSTHGFDRAVLLLPTWLLLVVWTVTAGLAVTGLVTNDIIGPALLGGLVLIVMLIGFTVMQHAFAGGITHGIVSDVERRALALTGSGEIIWDWDVSADKIYTSPEAEHMLGLKHGHLEGPASTWLNVLHPLDRDRFRASLDAVVEQRRGRLNQHFRLRAADGHDVWVSLKARPVVGSDGEVVRLIGTMTNISDFKNAEERMLFDAVHDSLTRLPNRELFLDRIKVAFTSAQADVQKPPAVLVMDIDRFKEIDELVGSAVGDSILLTISRRLSRLLKPQDTLARLLGDQFGLILVSEREATQIVRFAETLRRALRSPIAFNEHEISLTASIGLALADDRSQAFDDVLKNAEVAMHYAKTLGGDRIEIYKPAMRSRKTDKATIESELRHAIERGQIDVLFQPIVRLEDRATVGFDAVVRWKHPTLSRMPESELFSIAEEIGTIVELGLFVLDRTVHQLSEWQAANRARAPVFATVNISSRQLLRRDLIQDLRNALSRKWLARGTLKLKIPESLVMENPEQAVQLFARLKGLGTGLSLGGFGAAHSSLAYLQRLPFDMMEIDQTLVRTDATGKRPAILHPVIGLAHELGLEVVAKGVDTDSDAVELYQLGCEYAQGAVFGEPVSAGAAYKLIAVRRTAAQALSTAALG